mgnify:CR=1 FL=1
MAVLTRRLQRRFRRGYWSGRFASDDRARDTAHGSLHPPADDPLIFTSAGNGAVSWGCVVFGDLVGWFRRDFGNFQGWRRHAPVVDLGHGLPSGGARSGGILFLLAAGDIIDAWTSYESYLFASNSPSLVESGSVFPWSG